MDSLIPSIMELGRCGYQTDLRQQTRSLTHYTKADNCIFEVDGQIRKFGGATKVNEVAITSAPNITGMCDFWFGGGSSSFTQKHVVITSNSKVYKDDMDGTYDDITGAASITANAIPVFAVAKSVLVIAFSTRDTILKWTGTGDVATLSGAPSGKGVIYHANRLWVWDGSVLRYSGYDNVEDWTSYDSGRITLDDGDGDEIIGACTYKESLVIFKGPNKGKIIVLTGRSPMSIVKDVTILNIPLQTHNSIVTVGDDKAFMSPRGVHLLSQVLTLGNHAEADITRFLRRHFTEKLNRSRLNEVWGVNYTEKSCLLWATPTPGASENNQIFGLSYIRLQEDGWKSFTVTRGCNSLGIRKHPTTKIDEVITGNTDGFVRRQDMSGRAIDTTTGYTMNLTSPNIAIGLQDMAGKSQPDLPVSVESIYIRSETSKSYPIAALITRDNFGSEGYSFALGSVRGSFVLGSSILGGPDTLGGSGVEIAYSDPPAFGQARTVKFQIIQGGVDKDANLIEMGINHKPISQSRMSGFA